jgi:hypothetical protein
MDGDELVTKLSRMSSGADALGRIFQPLLSLLA